MGIEEAKRTPGSNPDPSKQIKVKLPIEIILRLQEIRITEGRSVADVVTTAVNEYLHRNYKSRAREGPQEPRNQLPDNR